MLYDLYSHFLADAQIGIILGVTANVLCGGWK